MCGGVMSPLIGRSTGGERAPRFDRQRAPTRSPGKNADATCGNRTALGSPRKILRPELNVEAEFHDVAVLHDVVLALHAHLAGGTSSGHRTSSHQIVVTHDFCLDETALKISVNDTC